MNAIADDVKLTPWRDCLEYLADNPSARLYMVVDSNSLNGNFSYIKVPDKGLLVSSKYNSYDDIAVAMNLKPTYTSQHAIGPNSLQPHSVKAWIGPIVVEFSAELSQHNRLFPKGKTIFTPPGFAIPERTYSWHIRQERKDALDWINAIQSAAEKIGAAIDRTDPAERASLSCDEEFIQNLQNVYLFDELRTIHPEFAEIWENNAPISAMCYYEDVKRILQQSIDNATTPEEQKYIVSDVFNALLDEVQVDEATQNLFRDYSGEIVSNHNTNQNYIQVINASPKHDSQFKQPLAAYEESISNKNTDTSVDDNTYQKAEQIQEDIERLSEGLEWGYITENEIITAYACHKIDDEVIEALIEKDYLMPDTIAILHNEDELRQYEENDTIDEYDHCDVDSYYESDDYDSRD